jgi:hypothetical protein
MTAPSNSAPRPLLMVVGLNAFQIMFSLKMNDSLSIQILVEMLKINSPKHSNLTIINIEKEISKVDP